jgi:aryl-alcohol dehydrogenase-like predicted oxidoreductase
VEFRHLGHSGLQVSALTFGTMTFGGVGPSGMTGATDLAGAKRQVGMCLDAGVNMFDSADTYSDGVAEEILGEAISGFRSEVLVATKGRFPSKPGPNLEGLSRHHLLSSCDASLRRLKTDYIDLYQLHGWDGRTPLEETLRALDDLQRAGKVRYVGVSNFAGWQLMKALGKAQLHDLVRPISQQIHYTLAAREAEYELVPIALDQGVGILVWSPLSGGLLTGKYSRGRPIPAGTRAAAGWEMVPIHDEDQVYDVIEALLAIAEAHGVSAAQIVIAWLLARTGVTSVVIGARTDSQLADTLAAANLVLTDAEMQELDRASAPPLIYPYWHQARYGGARSSTADVLVRSRSPGA